MIYRQFVIICAVVLFVVLGGSLVLHRYVPTQSSSPGPSLDQSVQISALQDEVNRLKARLEQVEPPAPILIPNPGYDDKALTALSSQNVQSAVREGKSLPFGLVDKSATWQPPAYAPGWHSTSGNRFASVRALVATARQRFLIDTVFTGSLATATTEFLQLTDSHPQPCGKTPEYPCHTPNDAAGSWKIYALKAHVKAVRQLGSLVVFEVEPTLQGYEVIWLDNQVLHEAFSSTQQVWAVFATSNGDVWEAMPRMGG